MESMESLKARFLDDIYQVHAAVTAEDYEHIVKNVPGLCIDKVRAYRSPKKNAVCIAVKPAHPGMPKLSGKYKQMISQALEEKRMLNTVFELEQPFFIRTFPSVLCYRGKTLQFYFTAFRNNSLYHTIHPLH